MSFEIVDPPLHGTFIDSVYTPSLNFNGEDLFTFRALDGELADTATVNITVLPVNDPPVLSDIEDIFIPEDSTAIVNIIYDDVDGDEIEILVELSDSVNVLYELDSTSLQLTPVENFVGSVTITIEIYDGQYTDEVDFILHIESVNDAPIVEDFYIETDEDIPVEIGFTGFDIDGDELAFEVVDAPLHGVVVDGVYTPEPNYNGSDVFTYRAFDGNDYSEPATVDINVFPVNDAPELSEIGNQETLEDTPLSITISIGDIDEDELTLSVELSLIHI